VPRRIGAECADSVEVWSLLTEQRGWSGQEYADWVGRAMADAVLRPDAG
jgi:hypothetical protein